MYDYKEDDEINKKRDETTDIDKEEKSKNEKNIVFQTPNLFPINFDDLNSTDATTQTAALQHINALVSDGYLISDLETNVIYRILDFIESSIEEQSIASLHFFQQILLLSTNDFNNIYNPHFLELLNAAIDNTMSPEIMSLALQCCASLNDQKHQFISREFDPSDLYTHAINGIESATFRFPNTKFTKMIKQSSIDFFVNILNSFTPPDDVLEQLFAIIYNELNGLNADGQQMSDSDSCEVYILNLVIKLCEDFTEFAQTKFFNQDFLNLIYQDINADNQTQNDLLFKLTETFIKKDYKCAPYIIYSNFFSEYLSEISNLNENQQSKLFNVLSELISAFNQYADVKDIQGTSYENALRNIFEYVPSALSLIIEACQKGSFSLKFDGTLLACNIILVRPNHEVIMENGDLDTPLLLSQILVGNPEIVNYLIEMLDGKEREVDYNIIRALRRIIAYGTIDVSENTFEINTVSYYIQQNFLSTIISQEFHDKLDEIRDEWEEDEKIDLAIAGLLEDIEKYVEHQNIDIENNLVASIEVEI